MRLIILLFPLLELYTLIVLGDAYGALTAIAWVVAGVFLGMSMIRRQGLSMIQQLQRDAASGLVSTRMLGDDLAVVTSGLLFMVPGLVTDMMAALVLIGPLRRRIAGFGPTERVAVHGFERTHGGSGASGRSDEAADSQTTLEGDYQRVDD